MLPLLYDDNKAAKTTGCTAAASHALRGRGMKPLLRSGDKQKEAYDAASAGYRRRKTLLALRDRSQSLGLFLEQLDRTGVPGLSSAASSGDEPAPDG